MAALVCAAFAAGPSFASADVPPPFGGDMGFPDISGPLGPEEYSWEVILGDDQELQLVNEQLALVYYVDSDHLAYAIVAEAAHDADGSTVPTSLSVSEGSILTLHVHHRDGNPAKDWAPFEYPVVPGVGWEGGFSTSLVVMPPPEALPQTVAVSDSEGCLVPRLKGRTLEASKRRLRKANCKIGEVSKKRRGATGGVRKVARQSPKPGVLLASGATVDITLGERSPVLRSGPTAPDRMAR